MNVIYTEDASNDLIGILRYTAIHYPTTLQGLTTRLRQIEAQIAAWPESAPIVDDGEGARMVPFVRYPFKLFYAIRNERIEILHIHHAARNTPP